MNHSQLQAFQLWPNFVATNLLAEYIDGLMEFYEMSPIGERNIAYPILKILKISLSALGCYYRYQMNIDTQVVFLIRNV